MSKCSMPSEMILHVPTIHARNLFHTSVAMYDAWAVFEPEADTYFLGKEVHGFRVPFQVDPDP